ncbi:signal transduction histidine kinase [Solirubrobacter pauli]|uniref:histidine kinase n=1 Tax=Solirubrobacter pauli TaxID=166793 RepID=A0A660LAB1_9ACTN|nr:histidine kinase [Solirubrobacter pauli]RKQ91489.1 signal transduction histidine kinase [Solirubrobacter pauli]
MPDRLRLPLLIGLAVVVELQLELALLVSGGTPYRALASLALLAMAVAVVAGRWFPLTALLTVFAGVALLPMLSRHYYDELFLAFASPFVVSFWLGLRATRWELAVGIPLAGALSLVATTPYDDDAALSSGVFTALISVGAPVLIGRLLRGRAALNRALREKAAQLERQRAVAAGRAVLDERERIAGELHDVVAHALSAMTVQATGARRLTLTRPDLAREAFAAIESTGREALDELRRLLGVLRSEDAESTLAPQPSLRHLRSLTRRTSAAGLPVVLRVDGDAVELPAGLDVTAYRVIQEALAAARELGAAGRADVRVIYRAETLDLEVRDDGASVSTRPLAGIRERVLLHGGRFTSAPRRSGGHAVRATLAYDGRPVTARANPELKRPGRLTFPRARRGRPAWLRRPGNVDALVAGLFAVAAVVEVVVSPDREGPLVANVALALGYASVLVWRRRAPVAALAGALGAALLMDFALTPILNLFVPFAIVLACAYATGAHRDGARTYVGLVLAVGGLLAVQAAMGPRVGADYFFAGLIGAVAWFAGRVVRARTRLTAELHEATARLAETGEDEQRQAAVDERRRIAREMHDVVAHSISVMVVQAGGARRILARDAGRAVEAATRIERTGREALGEMRNLLGMLSDGSERAALAPQPRLAEIGELVARARASGLPAVLDVCGERRALPAGLDLTAYRIVQEGLTNAMKHAPGAPTTVTVSWAPHDLALEIRNAAGQDPGPRGGHGLVGMAERVRIYGGELRAGPDDGGWRVSAHLPLTERVAVPDGAASAAARTARR